MRIECTADASFIASDVLLRQESEGEGLRFLAYPFETMIDGYFIDLVIMNVTSDEISDVRVQEAHVGGLMTGSIGLDVRQAKSLIAQTMLPLEHRIIRVPWEIEAVGVSVDLTFSRRGRRVRSTARVRLEESPPCQAAAGSYGYNLVDTRSDFQNKRICSDTSSRALSVAAALPSMLRSTSPSTFEEMIAELFRRYGFEATVVGRTGDGGTDVVATSRNPLSPSLHVVQCKRYSNAVGVHHVRELLGMKFDKKANRAVLVTTSRFTRGATQLAERHAWEVGLIDYAALCELLRNVSGVDSGPVQECTIALV